MPGPSTPDRLLAFPPRGYGVPLAYRHDLTLAVHAVAWRAIEGWYRDTARALRIADGRTGSITQRERDAASHHDHPTD